MFIHTNRHPSTDGSDWGWIDGCTLNICWADNTSFNRVAAAKFVKEYEAAGGETATREKS